MPGPVAVAYVAPERMTLGTCNLYLIAVAPDRQCRSIGAQLVREDERLITARDARVLIVETSGLPDYVHARAFYLTNGYTQEACVRECYAEGEDKIVFWKKLSAQP